MSDTPRTDAHNWNEGDYDDPLHSMADFAMQLERELNAANAKIKRLEEAETTIAELVQRMKEDGEYICTLSERCLQYHEAVLKYKEEIKGLTDKIQQLYEGAEEQRQRIKRLEEAGNQLKDRYILENENWDLKTVNDWNKAKEEKP
jgi:predicted RNase H-like nuclease (RuvC/YqgF family)